MKVDASDLFKVLREVVRDELKKALPGMVREVLAESYVRQLVSEGLRSNSANVSRSVQSVLPKSQGRTADPQQLREMIKAKVTEEEVLNDTLQSPLLDSSNPMSFVYEGVNVPPEEAVVGPPSIALDRFGIDPDKMRAFVTAPTPNRTDARGNAEFEERRLAKLRASLDVKVG